MKLNSIKHHWKIWVCASYLCLLTSKNADASSLMDIYNSFSGNNSGESSSNYTAPGGFQDQAAGHYSGGGFAVRQNNMVIQPIQISLPHFGGRCGQIDMILGSLSIMRMEEVVELGRAVLQGAPIYAFQLALKTSAPQIEGLMSEYMEIVRKLNAFSVEQCAATQALVGGLWPANSAASEQICKDISASENNLDIFGARKHCRKDDNVTKALERTQEKHADLMTAERNLVWHLLDKMPKYQKTAQFDTDATKELLMNVAGTLISVKENNKFRYIHVAPKVNSQQFLIAYLRGGETQMLVCDDSTKCLKPSLTRKNIKEGAKDQVIRKIAELRVKYLNKQALTADEEDFLGNATTVPVYKYIQVSAATGSQFLTGDAAEYIAIAVLLLRFEVMMTEVLEAVEVISKIQINDGEINKFKEALKRARDLVSQRHDATILMAKNMLDQAIKAEEQSVLARSVQ